MKRGRRQRSWPGQEELALPTSWFDLCPQDADSAWLEAPECGEIPTDANTAFPRGHNLGSQAIAPGDNRKCVLLSHLALTPSHQHLRAGQSPPALSCQVWGTVRGLA